jgi:hypothetical protein
VRISIVTLALFLAAGAAGAEEEPVIQEKPLQFIERAPMLTVSGTFTEAFDAEMLAQLSSGFTTTVVLRMYLYKRGSEIVLWKSGATWRVVYDLWGEVYLIKAEDQSGERSFTAKTRADALIRVTTMADLPVAPLAVVDPGVDYFIGVEVDVNPVSPELLGEVRRSMTRPSLGGASFFGGFVSIFLNTKIAEADRTLTFRSKAFYRARPQ